MTREGDVASLPGFLGRLLRKLGAMRDRRADRRAVRRASRHIAGARHISAGPDDVTIVCLMRDAAFYLPELLRHHRAMGVRHFLFIDNGSTDTSRSMLQDQPDVTIIENLLPVWYYECRMRSEIARQFITGGWLLFIDTDELAEFPCGEGRSITEITHYCNRHGYDAVVSQMLDLFANAPLGESSDWSYEKSVQFFNRYSLNALVSFPYHSPDIYFSWFLSSNRVSNTDILFNFGGIRHEIFQEECALTKHSLVRNLPGLDIYSHPHCSSGVRCADFSMLIRHYKFAGDFLARERRQVRNETWTHGEDKRRLSIITSPDFRIDSAQARQLRHVDQLVEEGFLATSDQFRRTFCSRPA